MAPAAPDTAHAPPNAAPRYQWASEFLGAFTVQLINPPESFGPGPDGMHITNKARRYLSPLIRGEDYPPYKDGLPQYVTLKNVAVKKKIAQTFVV